MNYWLLKSEPEAFSIADLARRPRRTEHWDGVRNYQARNYLREMRRGDHAFFYHSNCAVPGIAGIVSIVREGYPDFTAFDPDDPHYDPKSTPDRPRWFMVDVRHERAFERIISLQELKSFPALAGMRLLARGNRLSVMPVTAAEWSAILSLE
ncbi:MAG: EVE domain-containing protein [Gammaproteobacteria bacterium]|nr:EVE domain-containing protein [Gammaproteobacteria bacterium]